MILRPDGLLARQTMLPMTARQMTWFIDPEACLRHLADFSPVLHLAVFCQHCYQRGLPEDVSATFQPDMATWRVQCACADYPLLHSHGDGPLTINQTHDDGTVTTVRITSVDELLFRLGWSFKCGARCAALGMYDGVQGLNDPAGHTLKVSCGCTERVYRDSGVMQ